VRPNRPKLQPDLNLVPINPDEPPKLQVAAQENDDEETGCCNLDQPLPPLSPQPIGFGGEDTAETR